MTNRHQIKDSVRALLDSIHNRPPGIRQQCFSGPPESIPGLRGGFLLEWWITEERPLLTTALALANNFPALRDRYAVTQMGKTILAILQTHLDCFHWEPFISIARGATRTLLECARPEGLETVVSALIAWAQESDRSIFLMPIRGLRPSSDLISPTLVWVSSTSAVGCLTSLLQLPMLPETLTMFPPWMTGPSSGQRPLSRDDSLLGVHAVGWQAGIAELRRAAGAICVAIPDAEVYLRSSPAWSDVLQLSERGRQAFGESGPILPSVGNVHVLNEPELEILRSALVDRTTKRERRFRIALEFLSAGWVMTGAPEFMNYFLALDALYGQGKGWTGEKLSSNVRNPADRAKVKLLAGIRGELFHGHCSSVETNHWYLEYYQQFQEHPTEDLFHIVRRGLRNEPCVRAS
jgi:hypothetical protein